MSFIAVAKVLETCSASLKAWIRPATTRPAYLHDLDARTLRDIGVVVPGAARQATSVDSDWRLPR